MPTYTSRHNPRKQLTVLGLRIGHAETYDRFYDVGWEALDKGLLPVTRLNAGRLLFRKSGATIEQSRTIRDAAHSSQALGLRYNGMRLTGADGQGALYLASLGGLMREQVHYGGAGGAARVIKPGDTDRVRAAVRALSAGHVPATTASDCHVYRLRRPLLLADITVLRLAGVFNEILSSRGGRARFGISPLASTAGLISSVLASDDYSAARGLADAVHDAGGRRGIAGMVATSARGDADSGVILDNQGDGVEGFVYALFGASEQRLDVLQPVASYTSFKQLRDAVHGMPGFTRIL